MNEQTLAVDYADYTSTTTHLIRNGKSLCGLAIPHLITNGSYGITLHADCARCVAKNGGVER